MDAFRGVGLILSRPRLWPLCLAPTIAGLAAYILLAWWAYQQIPESAYHPTARLIYFLLVLCGLALLSVVVMSAFIGVIFDPLSREAERELSGETPPAIPFSWSQLFGDSLGRLGFNALMGLAAMLVGLIPVIGPVLSVAAAGVIGLLDYTSVAYLRRGKAFGVQRRELLRALDRPTVLFGVIVGLSSLIPGLGLILAPGFIVGGTILARRRLV